ncbi:FAD/NAD(P)-binding protein [Aquisalimonas sp.]|uniref:FAD/NAD(P)-binding protein n=1 Tax=Aquisalimonas sp. TaxID=1872621 RepID=UPI0025BBDD7B|nr:FAD/NAD(P)-binding protein [Aquisalimonas sp.]
MIPRQFRIEEAFAEVGSGEVYSWRLSPLDGEPLRFAPGQFNMLYQFGIGEVPISISGDAEAAGLVHTLRAVGGVTKAMQKLEAGEVIGVRGPFGTAWPVAEAEGQDLVLVAGGIGLAPLRPAVYCALRHRDRFNRVFLLYGTRQPEDILFREELEHWRAQLDLDVYVTVDRGGPGWHGNVGVVTKLIARGGFDPANTVAMACGPEVMMRFAVMALQKHGVAAERIYVSMERNMKCAIGYCGHCQYGPHFICKDGPVFRFDTLQPIFDVREL